MAICHVASGNIAMKNHPFVDDKTHKTHGDGNGFTMDLNHGHLRK